MGQMSIMYMNMKETHAELPKVLHAQLLYAINYEMAVKPTDLFIRRTGAMFFNIDQVKSWKEQVIAEMSAILGWSETERTAYTAELDEEITRATTVL